MNKSKIICGIFSAALLLVALPAAAITVNSTADDTLANLALNATCDLREAVAAVNSGVTVAQCTYDTATITFAPALSGQTINFAAPSAGACAVGGFALALCRSATISGPSGGLIINSAATGGGFYLSPEISATAKINVAIDHIAMTGAIYGAVSVGSNNGFGVNLNLDSMSIYGNASTNYGAGLFFNQGGLVYLNRGTLTISNSSFYNNTAAWAGGGVYTFSAQQVSISNTTIDGNASTTQTGGGVNIAGDTAALTFNQVTLTNNAASTGGGGIRVENTTSGILSQAALTNSIIAGNSSTAGAADISFSPWPISPPGDTSVWVVLNNVLGVVDANVSAKMAVTPANSTGNITTFPAIGTWLGVLAANGGPTKTRALLAGAPAIDMANSGYSTMSFDQRGTGYPRISGGIADAGAYEFQQVAVNGTCVTGQTLTTAPINPNLCTAGTASAVTSGASSYTWSCNGSNGGTNATSCSAIRNYVVTTSVSGGNGTISANQNVAYNATPSFTLMPNAGYTASAVIGTCGGTRTGNSYTTNAVTANCTVVASFVVIPPTQTTYSGPTATGTGTATANVSGGGAGCGFTGTPQFVPLGGSASGSTPAGVTFPHGLFNFTLNGCTAGSTATMSITYPNAVLAGTQYWKYGPTPGGGANSTPHWYTIPAIISGNTLTFSITDGGLGDDDLTANGTIVDPSGAGVQAQGNGVTAIPTLSEWGVILLAGMLGLFGMGVMRRHA